jgi:hypothetical protein
MLRRLSIITTILAMLTLVIPSTATAASPTIPSNLTTHYMHSNEPISDLHFSTFLGGTSSDFYSNIAVDNDGYIYVAGRTTSPDFPTTPEAYDRIIDANACGSELCGDVFIAKLDPSGHNLIYSTFLGGSSVEYSFGIAVDWEGAAYITGATSSSDFSTTPGAFNTTFESSGSIFISKLSPNGKKLIYSTLIGPGQSQKIAVDRRGAAYITGSTVSPDFPVTQGAFDTTKNSGADAFVLKLNKTGTALVMTTATRSRLMVRGRPTSVDRHCLPIFRSRPARSVLSSVEVVIFSWPSSIGVVRLCHMPHTSVGNITRVQMALLSISRVRPISRAPRLEITR